MSYSERLWPSAWLYIACALVIPASLLVFLPISITAGVICAAVLYLGAMGLLIIPAPRIEVSGRTLRVGRAHIDVALVGTVAAYRAAEATAERGVRLDARAFLCLRPWIDPVVRIELLDISDPAPYWLASSRRPDELIGAIETAKALTS
ncbi:DUF3093 domain-containing protein [Naasia lichenicola]|uniref:DUF3093 domain-containing protein n=1 Tax=Naasia lichenicola TaxID=2565933 RepID=UPI001E4EFA3D|nr:DUF3093 domain-containing protein [Naasia lichenicola]